MYFNTNLVSTLERVKWWSDWGVASRIDFTGPAHTGERITDRNQLAALTLHDLFSHRAVSLRR